MAELSSTKPTLTPAILKEPSRKERQTLPRPHAALLIHIRSRSLLNLTYKIRLRFLTSCFFSSLLLNLSPCFHSDLLPSILNGSQTPLWNQASNNVTLLLKILEWLPGHLESNPESPSWPPGPRVICLCPSSSLDSLHVIPRRPFCCSLNIPNVFLLQSQICCSLHLESFFPRSSHDKSMSVSILRSPQRGFLYCSI